MKKKIILLRVIPIILSFIPLLEAGGSPLSPQPDCPACASFGVQRFQGKKDAPSFSLKDLNGNTVVLAGIKGKPLLLTFWATWCPACKEDMPLLEKFSEGKRDRLNIFLIAIDGEKENRVQRFVRKNKITIPVLLDVKEKISRAYGVKMVPTTFLVDGEGLLVGVIVGQRNWLSPEGWAAVRELLSL